MEEFEESKRRAEYNGRTKSKDVVCVHTFYEAARWRTIEYSVEEDFIILMNSHISLIKLTSELH